MVVGITGKCCSGKTQLIEKLEQAGFHIIEVDTLGHIALEKKQKEIVAAFDSSILDHDGKIDRHVLGEQVFRHKKALRKLEAIVHPYMIQEIKRIVSTHPGDLAINAAILAKMGLDTLCDLIFWVDAPLFDRIQRALKRDFLSLSQCLRRVWAQRKLQLKYLSQDVDIYRVRNGNRSRIDLERIMTIINERKKKRK